MDKITFEDKFKKLIFADQNEKITFEDRFGLSVFADLFERITLEDKSKKLVLTDIDPVIACYGIGSCIIGRNFTIKQS